MTRVLVPVRILEGEGVSPGLMNLLGTVDVTVLGYHVLPEQTPPDQARAQYEERATDALEDLSEEFRSAGGEADHRLVFTHDREQTIRRVADEVNARAFAITGITGDVDSILVSLSGDVAVDRVLGFVEEVVGDREIGVTLFLAEREAEEVVEEVAEEMAEEVAELEIEEGVEEVEELAEEDTEKAARISLDAATERLREAGIDAETRVEKGRKPFAALMDAVPGHDAVVLGEKAPSLRSLVFGDEADHVAEASVGPVLVVRYDEKLDG